MEKMTIAEASQLATRLREEIGKSIYGQHDLILEALCCFLAGGHVLITGAPGLAKTTLVRVFASHLGLKFGRIQYTPDLLPSDIIGTELLHVDQSTGKRYFEFSKGPIFVNLLLADEINRATPRTQSAMLEAMQERRVTVGHDTHGLPQPFMVFATQNPFESEGTFPLPEAQLDRFLMHSLVQYPDADSEWSILKSHAMNKLAGENSLTDSDSPIGPEKTRAMMEAVKSVEIDDSILEGINHLIRATRPESTSMPEHLRTQMWYGSGPRGGIALVSCAKALALIEGSDRVRWAHIKRLAKPVLRHRLRTMSAAGKEGERADRIIEEVLELVERTKTKAARGLE